MKLVTTLYIKGVEVKVLFDGIRYDYYQGSNLLLTWETNCKLTLDIHEEVMLSYI